MAPATERSFQPPQICGAGSERAKIKSNEHKMQIGLEIVNVSKVVSNMRVPQLVIGIGHFSLSVSIFGHFSLSISAESTKIKRH